MRVLAVDPGLTTGWVIFTPEHRELITVQDWGEIRGDVEFGRWAQEQAGRGIDYVVCENYVPYYDGKKRTWEPEPIFVIGMLRLIYGAGLVDLRGLAKDANNFGTAERITPYRKGPLHVGKGGGGHALMALRHALLWTANRWKGR